MSISQLPLPNPVMNVSTNKSCRVAKFCKLPMYALRKSHLSKYVEFNKSFSCLNFILFFSWLNCLAHFKTCFFFTWFWSSVTNFASYCILMLHRSHSLRDATKMMYNSSNLVSEFISFSNVFAGIIQIQTKTHISKLHVLLSIHFLKGCNCMCVRITCSVWANPERPCNNKKRFQLAYCYLTLARKSHVGWLNKVLNWNVPRYCYHLSPFLFMTAWLTKIKQDINIV